MSERKERNRQNDPRAADESPEAKNFWKATLCFHIH